MIVFQIFLITILLQILWSLLSKNFKEKRKQKNNFEFQKLTTSQKEILEDEKFGVVELLEDGIEYNGTYISWEGVVCVFSEKIDINILDVVSLGFEFLEDGDRCYIQIHEKTKGFNKVTETLQEFIDLEEDWYKNIFAEAEGEIKTIWKKT